MKESGPNSGGHGWFIIVDFYFLIFVVLIYMFAEFDFKSEGLWTQVALVNVFAEMHSSQVSI